MQIETSSSTVRGADGVLYRVRPEGLARVDEHMGPPRSRTDALTILPRRQPRRAREAAASVFIVAGSSAARAWRGREAAATVLIMTAGNGARSWRGSRAN